MIKLWPELQKSLDKYYSTVTPEYEKKIAGRDYPDLRLKIWQCPICLKTHMCWGYKKYNKYCNGRNLIDSRTIKQARESAYNNIPGTHSLKKTEEENIVDLIKNET